MSDEVVMEGYCTKQGAVWTNWRRRYFILRKDGFLYYYKPVRESSYTKSNAKGIVRDFTDILSGDSCHLGDAWPKDAPTSCRFSIFSPDCDRTYNMYCDNAAEADRWIAALNRMADQRKKMREMGIA
eukprot:TRINITY_DN27824_c0_g1_i1.p2 TRINITY_DN27824_c0_g1~~TRINITY_DN27824_c0_g1_i1.p2  ORF type:complete len:127 (+),score=27.14 TRINITY_DN27824_c0_g1_i1:154-534(+)